jgi:hypothetical protein
MYDMRVIRRSQLSGTVRAMTAREAISWIDALSFYKARYGWYFESQQRMVFGPYRTEAIARQKAALLAEALTGWVDSPAQHAMHPPKSAKAH